MYKITLFLLLLPYFFIINLCQAMDDTTSFSQSDYEKGIFTAQHNASFTFQVNHKEFLPFTIHFTNHNLSISTLCVSTHQTFQTAQTIVLEPLPWDDEPKERLPKFEEVFKKHFVDPNSHQRMKSELSTQDYEKLATYCQKVIPKLFMDGYFVKFEDLNPLSFCFFLRKLQRSQEANNGMDQQIEQLAIEQEKILTGLESFYEKMITEMPLALQAIQQTRGPFLIQDICWYLHNLSSEAPIQPEERLNNSWDSHYTEGQFFLLCCLSDQENANDVDNVKIRDAKWIPRIKAILSAPYRYPPPISVNVGFGHHGILGMLEKDGFELFILNKQGEAYPFQYTRCFTAFQKENIL